MKHPHPARDGDCSDLPDLDPLDRSKLALVFPLVRRPGSEIWCSLGVEVQKRSCRSQNICFRPCPWSVDGMELGSMAWAE